MRTTENNVSATMKRIEKGRGLHVLAKKLTCTLALLCIGSAFQCCSILAQTIGTGSVQGTIEDQSGAVIANANVTALDPQTGFKVSQHTSGAGT